jgi:hypothetical protein
VSARFRRSAARVFVVAAALAVGGCGELPPPAAVTAAAARTAPEDGDAWGLVPEAASSLVDLDLAALRASPWSRSLVTGGFAEDREERLRTFGYDVFDDADRLVLAALDVAGQAQQVVVVTGRLDAARVARAFAESTPGAAEARWRDCRIWEKGDRSVGLVGRALVHGTPDTVRAAIDAAWGVVPSARGGVPGELARAVDGEVHRPAVLLAVVVTDELRARAAGNLDVPPALRRLVARLDLGGARAGAPSSADLELEAQAILDDAASAKAAARAWAAALGEVRGNRLLRVMGLGPVVEGTTLQLQGARVLARLRVPEADRDALSERFLLLLKALVKARAEAGAAPP